MNETLENIKNSKEKAIKEALNNIDYPEIFINLFFTNLQKDEQLIIKKLLQDKIELNKTLIVLQEELNKKSKEVEATLKGYKDMVENLIETQKIIKGDVEKNGK